jgi:hypothetical protein
MIKTIKHIGSSFFYLIMNLSVIALVAGFFTYFQIPAEGNTKESFWLIFLYALVFVSLWEFVSQFFKRSYAGRDKIDE